MSQLLEKKCISCSQATEPLNMIEAKVLLEQIPAWKIVNDHHLTRHFKFKNFKTALSFLNIVGEISEEENHHPDVFVSFINMQIDIWTHKINGLTESDFILAAKISEVFDREFRNGSL